MSNLELKVEKRIDEESALGLVNESKVSYVVCFNDLEG